MCFLKTCCDSIKHLLLDHLTMLDQHICMHLSGVIMAENEKLSMSVIEPDVPDLDLLNVMALWETFGGAYLLLYFVGFLISWP